MEIGGNRRLVCPKAKQTDAVNGGEIPPPEVGRRPSPMQCQRGATMLLTSARFHSDFLP